MYLSLLRLHNISLNIVVFALNFVPATISAILEFQMTCVNFTSFHPKMTPFCPFETLKGKIQGGTLSQSLTMLILTRFGQSNHF